MSSKFSEHLFWDCPEILKTENLESHASWVIERVLERGEISDLKLMETIFTRTQIIEVARNSRRISARTEAFAETIWGEKARALKVARREHATALVVSKS